MINLKMEVSTDRLEFYKRIYGDDEFQKYLRALGVIYVKEIRTKAKFHIYNKPESPNYKRTWNLYNTILSKPVAKLKVLVESAVPYAIYVHEGTSRMSPRPYFKDGIEVAKKKQGQLTRKWYADR